MPIYEYRCPDCEVVFEELQSGFDEHAATCPKCGGQAPRVMSSTSFILKGSGWYVTDYCGKDKASASSTPSDKHTESKSCQAKADTPAKPAATASTPAAS